MALSRCPLPVQPGGVLRFRIALSGTWRISTLFRTGNHQTVLDRNWRRAVAIPATARATSPRLTVAGCVVTRGFVTPQFFLQQQFGSDPTPGKATILNFNIAASLVTRSLATTFLPRVSGSPIVRLIGGRRSGQIQRR